MQERFRGIARQEGLPFGDHRRTFNTRLAQELGKWAESKGRGMDFHNAVFRACFGESRNIGRVPVLIDIAMSVDLPGQEAEKVLESRSFKASVDRDWSRSRDLGVTAVPTLLINGERMVGAQPQESMERFLRLLGVKGRRPGA